MDEQESAKFLTDLSETIAWVNLVLKRSPFDDVAERLRSKETRPPFLVDRRRWTVEWVQDMRREALAGTSLPPHDLAGGRLLVYIPDDTLSEGASELASKGIFDSNDVPPWDTWVGFFERDPPDHDFLVSWMPPRLLELADYGVDVNSTACILWLDDFEHPLRDALWAQFGRPPA